MENDDILTLKSLIVKFNKAMEEPVDMEESEVCLRKRDS